jgi:hypothetical protein
VPARTPGNLAALLLLIFGVAGSLSTDLVRAGEGVKGDEATYVAMALSAAHDWDLAYERRDLERFWAIYGSGPEGIFLKTGQHVAIEVGGGFPFVRTRTAADGRTDRLYYGKAFAYSVAAAPFARLAGINGLLLFNVVLFVGAFLASYHFLAARTSSGVALVLALGFFLASVTPVYLVWLTPEIFNLALVCFAYFLWLYKHVAPAPSNLWGRWLRSPSTDLVAAVLLGIAVYSKPLILPLVAPPVAYHLWRRDWRTGIAVGLVAGLATAVAFGTTAAVSGDWNYQGGDRKTFYGRFPFDAPDATFATLGLKYATDSVSTGFAADPWLSIRQLGDNLTYFVAGRYTGLLPYYFPSFIALGACLWFWRRVVAAQWLILGALGFAAIGMLIWLPFTWAGGGGAPGNRYFLSLYPALLFAMPPVGSLRGMLAAWAGASFMAPLLVSPFVTSTHPWQHAAHGLFRFLPVELTMMNDLPVMIDPGRGRVPYGDDPQLLLYFLDDRVWREGDRLWVGGEARTEVVVRTGEPLAGIRATLRSPIPNVVTVGTGADTRTVEIAEGQVVVVQVAVRPAISRGGHAAVLSIEAARGFVPRLADPGSSDRRFLGVEVRLAGVVAR